MQWCNGACNVTVAMIYELVVLWLSVWCVLVAHQVTMNALNACSRWLSATRVALALIIDALATHHRPHWLYTVAVIAETYVGHVYTILDNVANIVFTLGQMCTFKVQVAVPWSDDNDDASGLPEGTSALSMQVVRI